MCNKNLTQKEFEMKIIEIYNQANKYGVQIDFCLYGRDKDHLDCTWFGGEVGTITMPDSWVITIGAYGDIRLNGSINGNEIDIKDKNNSGVIYRELGNLINDTTLNNLVDGNYTNSYLTFENNNWFEVDLISPDGHWVDLCEVDNVLDNNILNCFEDISQYFKYVDWARNNCI